MNLLKPRYAYRFNVRVHGIIVPLICVREQAEGHLDAALQRVGITDYEVAYADVTPRGWSFTINATLETYANTYDDALERIGTPMLRLDAEWDVASHEEQPNEADDED